MPRAYFPLRQVAYPPPMTLRNGVRVATREQVSPGDLDDLQEFFNGHERRQLRDWHLALFYEWEGETGVVKMYEDAHTCLADTNLALQVVAPIGNHLAISIEEDEPVALDEGEGVVQRRLRRTSHHQLCHGTVWSRMGSYGVMTPEQIAKITNGVLHIFSTKEARMINPLRMFEHGLNSTNPYLCTFLWASALDGILMAQNPKTFVQRLTALLGADSLVFPPSDGVFFQRSTTVIDVAEDIYELRSEIAHGKPISRKFWEQNHDLTDAFPMTAYGHADPRYSELIEEAVLSLLKQVLHKIIAEDLLATFADIGKWRAKLRAS